MQTTFFASDAIRLQRFALCAADMQSRFFVPLAALALALAPSSTLAWGKTGHRVIGSIAQSYLTPQVSAGVKRILGRETLAEASNWPDFMRSDSSEFWEHAAGPWHYVTVAHGKSYRDVGAPPEGDAVTALKHFSAVVRDSKSSLDDQKLALRFIAHIVGDLHQPLHAGNGTDKGGNDVKVTFNGRSTNLHAVWDSGLVDDEQLSYSEMAAWLGARITPTEVDRWSTTDPALWIAESAALRDGIYPADGETSLSYRYVFDHTAQMELRLEQGGVRLAAYLNQLFAPTKHG